MAGKNKLLVNCSFKHYPNDRCEHVSNFSIILESIDIEDNDIFKAIYKKLVSLGFIMEDYQFMKSDDIEFTTQIFK